MIDKNDVKMPARKQDRPNQGRVNEEQIEGLLKMVNTVDSKQELRLNNENYYGQFHWFGYDHDGTSSYFSYQEEAVYDFIFNLNKSGILSDQVGMGKTIEAGMIISELAARHELKSLLIVVPDEIMAAKWEDELTNKFGLVSGGEKMLTAQNSDERNCHITAIKSFNDFCLCVYNCASAQLGVQDFWNDFKHTYDEKDGIVMYDIFRKFVYEDIERATEVFKGIFRDFADDYFGGIVPDIKFDAERNEFVLTAARKSFKRKYVFDRSGQIAWQYQPKKETSNFRNPANSIRNIINGSFFLQNIYFPKLVEELSPLFSLVGEYCLQHSNLVMLVAENLRQEYPFMVIPKTYKEIVAGKAENRDFLSRIIESDTSKSALRYKYRYSYMGNSGLEKAYEEYRVIDFFIDAAYQTLIVDEVHEYIKVANKISRERFHANNQADGAYAKYSSRDYNRYELFYDYYFIEKKSLYKKLKELSDRAERKIFLTATPITSDMVDFYLLTLIASNKDAESFAEFEKRLTNVGNENGDSGWEEAMNMLCDSLQRYIGSGTAYRCLQRNQKIFMVPEISENKQKIYKYPYFNNIYLRDNFNKEQRITDYLLGQMNYMTDKEIVLELIIAYQNEEPEAERLLRSQYDFNYYIEKIAGLLETYQFSSDYTEEKALLIARVVFRALLHNTLRQRFEEDFEIRTKDAGGNERVEYIERIGDLLKLSDGPRRWDRTYHKYGIRHTRHQTYNLREFLARKNRAAGEPGILSDSKQERYQNLPTWPKRNGIVLYLFRDDVFFDALLKVKRGVKEANLDVEIDNIPNLEKIAGEESEKKAKFDKAREIFGYINDQMTGELQEIPYHSNELDDKAMLEYKLTLVTMLMLGGNEEVQPIKGNVLLFADKDRDKILEWFRYMKCADNNGIVFLSEGEQPHEQLRGSSTYTLKEEKSSMYMKRWTELFGRDSLSDLVGANASGSGGKLAREWQVSENADNMQPDVNRLIIADPNKYEKGVDLQKADTIINFDINYDPLKMEQRVGRIDRIRPDGNNRDIRIISFVPLNDMSGFVINFYANEMKMFNQWMGETTGIVSISTSDNQAHEDEVNFENKIINLEKYYKDLYRLCMQSEEIEEKELNAMAERFKRYFSLQTDRISYDFKFVRHTRGYFDKLFRNSIVLDRDVGMSVDGSDTKKVIRFNSACRPSARCYQGGCEACPNNSICAGTEGGKNLNNSYPEFEKAVNDFLSAAIDFYGKQSREANKAARISSYGGNSEDVVNVLQGRWNKFKELKDETEKKLATLTDKKDRTKRFYVEYDKFLSIYTPIKKAFWDDVVEVYLDIILKQFYDQCDTVLEGAENFAKFVKTFSIAEFMNYLEIPEER